MPSRRPVMAIIGRGNGLPPGQEGLARDIGRLAVEAGFRVLTGGLGGVMAAASGGARSARNYREGDILAILPGETAAEAIAAADVVIPSGMGMARNVLVVRTADVVVAVGGGAGTLSEVAMAWQLGKPLIALAVEGWSGTLGGQALDDRSHRPILRVNTAADAVAAAQRVTSV